MTRLSTNDYLRAALAVLGEQGSEGLTIANLCARLGVTKGSFYHHFGGLSGFQDALLSFWESEHSRRAAVRSRAGQPSHRLADWVVFAVELPHASEAALRAWGRSRADVAQVVEQVDRRRERQLAELITAVGVERGPARSIARVCLLTLIGAQLRDVPTDRRRLRQSLDECTRLVSVAMDPRLASRVRVIE